MALSDLTLLTPQVIVSGGASISGASLLAGTSIQFGVVQKVFSGCTRVTVAQNVLFKSDVTRIIAYGNVQYFIISELDILSTEIAP